MDPFDAAAPVAKDDAPQAPATGSDAGETAGIIDPLSDAAPSDVTFEGGTAAAGAERSGDDSAVSVPSACELDGRYALRIVYDVSWVGTELLSIVPVIAAGEGELSFVVLMEAHANPSGLDADFRTCATTVPEFAATISREHYQTRFDAAIWDSPTMPVFSSRLDTACQEPGCAITGEPLVALLGVRLPSPDAAWPSDPSAGEWPDHDGDGRPGITARMLGPEEGPYAYPPLDVLSTRRVRAPMLGLRVVVGIDGVLDSCDALSGRAVQGSVETRAVDCAASTPPLACRDSELSFLNDNLPVWTVQAGTIEGRRLANDADCAAARGLFAPPPTSR